VWLVVEDVVDDKAQPVVYVGPSAVEILDEKVVEWETQVESLLVIQPNCRV